MKRPAIEAIEADRYEVTPYVAKTLCDYIKELEKDFHGFDSGFLKLMLKAAGNGEDIPAGAILFMRSTQKPTEQDFEWARGEIKKAKGEIKS